MASRQSTVDFLMEQLAGAGPVYAKRMFGEYGLFVDGTMVASVCGDRLFVKPTPGGRAWALGHLEVSPYVGAKPYLRMPGERWDDGLWLTQLIRVTAAELSPSKGKGRGRG